MLVLVGVCKDMKEVESVQSTENRVRGRREGKSKCNEKAGGHVGGSSVRGLQSLACLPSRR